MATTETATPALEGPSKTPRHQNGRWSGYRRLLWARMLELKREPEVIFWVFVFPLLLAFGLGIAFRDKPPDITAVAVIQGPKSQEVLDLLSRSPQHAGIHADVLSASAAVDGFRLGKYALVVNMDDAGLHYRYDPAR